MDLNNTNSFVVNAIDSEVKPEVDENKRICRCCLSTERRMAKIDNFRYLFMDLAEIIVTESDGLPQWICWECAALIRKCVRFKQKVLKAHTVLYDYHSRCVPFAIDGQDPELTKFSTPHLCYTSTLIFDNSKSKLGFHSELEHEKQIGNATLFDVEVSQLTECDQIKDVFVKNEDDLMELEGSLGGGDDFRLSETEDSQDIEVKQEKKKRVKKKTKEENKSEETDNIEKPKRRGRTTKLEIDETKIRIIKLDPIEQLKQREEECKSSLTLPFHCKLCYKGFSYESKLQNHMRKHSPSRGRFPCSLCSMCLPTSCSLSVHTLIHTRRCECARCGGRGAHEGSVVDDEL